MMQEVIVQNFLPKAETAMRDLHLVRRKCISDQSRLLLPEVHMQAPLNLTDTAPVPAGSHGPRTQITVGSMITIATDHASRTLRK